MTDDALERRTMLRLLGGVGVGSLLSSATTLAGLASAAGPDSTIPTASEEIPD
jgi:hypothetical protein